MWNRILFQHRLVWSLILWGGLAAVMAFYEYSQARLDARMIATDAAQALSEKEDAIWWALGAQMDAGILSDEAASETLEGMSHALRLTGVRFSGPDGRMIAQFGDDEVFASAQNADSVRSRRGLTSNALASTSSSRIGLKPGPNESSPDSAPTSQRYGLQVAASVTDQRSAIENRWRTCYVSAILWVGLYLSAGFTEHYRRELKRFKEQPFVPLSAPPRFSIQ